LLVTPMLDCTGYCVQLFHS